MIFSIFRFFCTLRFQIYKYCPNHTSMERLFILLSDYKNIFIFIFYMRLHHRVMFSALSGLSAGSLLHKFITLMSAAGDVLKANQRRIDLTAHGLTFQVYDVFSRSTTADRETRVCLYMRVTQLNLIQSMTDTYHDIVLSAGHSSNKCEYLWIKSFNKERCLILIYLKVYFASQGCIYLI